MYNFMIVDDDKLVRERILSLIPCDKLGLKLCGEAENGVQALEVHQNTHPQIAIIDINIPLIDGIDVAKAMLEEDPDIKVIIITGYGTLSTAQMAIRSGVVDYLFKPVNKNELQNVLCKVIHQLQAQSKIALEQQRIGRLLEQSLPLLRNRFFLSLMQKSPEELDETDLQEHLSDFGVPAQVANICVALIVLNADTRVVSEYISMQSILEEELEKRLEAVEIGCLFCHDMMQRTILVAYGNHKQFSSILEQKLSALRDKMRYVYHVDFFAGIGSPVPRFCHLQHSYLDAEGALDYRHIFGNNNIVNSATVKNIELPKQQFPSISYGEITDLLVSEKLEDIQSRIDQYMSLLSCMPQSSISFFRQKAIELLALLMAAANSLGVETPLQDSQQPLTYVQILSAESQFEVKKLIMSIAEKLVGEIHKKRKNNKVRALGSIKHYVYKNYANPELDLTEVAESVSLSPSYVSQLFKRYENCSFTEFLNHVRIEQAKKLLSTTHMRVYEVSEAVGYQNSKYFFQLFKQITGMRPREVYEASTIEPK